MFPRRFQPGEGPSRGLLHDCEIFGNLRLVFVSSSAICSPSPLWMLCLECLLPRHLEGAPAASSPAPLHILKIVCQVEPTFSSHPVWSHYDRLLYKGLSIYYVRSYNKAGSVERLPKGAWVHSKAYVLWKSTLNEEINLTLTFCLTSKSKIPLWRAKTCKISTSFPILY